MSAAKSSSAQDSKAVGLGWSGQNSNSGEEDALLLLASAASMAPEHKLPHLWLCETVVEVGEEGGEVECSRGFVWLALA